jgi:hypothetical protein
LGKASRVPGPGSWVDSAADTAESLAESLTVRLRSWEASLNDLELDADFVRGWADVTAQLSSLPDSHVRLLESEAGGQFDGRLARHQRRFLAIAEREEAEILLAAAGARPGVGAASAFGDRTRGRLGEAGQLLDLDACRSVTVVGCGAFPAAALFFHDRTPARIDALEVEPETARIAARVAARHGSPRLAVRCADGLAQDYAGADTVYVVNQVTPKRDVVHRICATAGAEARVLVRDPFGAGRLLADSADRELPPSWRIAAVGAVDPSFLSRHLLLARALGDSG